MWCLADGCLRGPLQRDGGGRERLPARALTRFTERRAHNAHDGKVIGAFSVSVRPAGFRPAG